MRGRLSVVEAVLPQRAGAIKDPHGLFELGFGTLPPFVEEVCGRMSLLFLVCVCVSTCLVCVTFLSSPVLCVV